MENKIEHPDYYTDGNIEVIDYIEDKGFGYHLGNVIKYVSRAGKKTEDPLPDLKKAIWYIERYIDYIKKTESEKEDMSEGLTGLIEYLHNVFGDMEC